MSEKKNIKGNKDVDDGDDKSLKANDVEINRAILKLHH